MARSLYRALTQIPTSKAPLPRLLSSRPNVPGTSIAVDAESEPEAERAAIKRLEDVVHRIIVKRAQPAWLPLRPGSSYWVPPRSRARGVAEMIGKLASSVPAKDPAVVIASHRGWPSSDYFKGAAQSSGEAETDSKLTAQPEDEEG